ncbi:Erg28 like protein-domain-containing protein [Cristinia sonorae]|uniref:Erg28 like protein-domain-containing protein n=1 Tax=Cristinia sonorae TaxID=1940300 RepID=A0A8K0UNM0_9AGAR|nr:Erg28 like protein-domain-containing protein [Cristinia sonorae]
MSSINALLSFLPQSAGWLPKWQLFIATVAFFNTIQNFTTLKFTRRVYSKKVAEVTPLQARTFGVWTLLSAAVRFYAAYHIHEKSVYDITLISYLIAFGHITSELLIFGSAGIAFPSLSPLIVSSVSLLWMFSQYEFYVNA